MKTSMVSFLAVAVLALQAWATPCKQSGSDVFCQWDTGCYAIDDEYGEPEGLTCDEYIASCREDGALYRGVTGLNKDNDYGKGLKCSDKGGTLIGGTTPSSGSGGSSSSRSSGGSSSSGSSSGRGPCKDPNKGDNQPLFCGYADGCYEVQNEYSDGGKNCSENSSAKGCEPCPEKIEACESKGKLYVGVRSGAINEDNDYGKGVVCADVGGQQVGGKEDCGGKYCRWETGCEEIAPDPTGEYGPKTATCDEAVSNCESDGKLFNSKSACENYTPSSSSRPSSSSSVPSSSSAPSSSSSSATSPIIKLSMSATSNIVKAIHNGVNVQLTGNAKIRVYDLKGNLARSLELAQGSYNVELSNMPHGTYIVMVIGNSWKQTVTVPVK